MKTRNFILFISMLLLSTVFVSCDKDLEENLNLDSALIGQWIFVDANGDIYSWTFKDDGNCVQTLYNVDYEWKWEIEDTKLKLYVDGGTPAYKEYKIEANKLYFWVESVEIWSLPFTKQ